MTPTEHASAPACGQPEDAARSTDSADFETHLKARLADRIDPQTLAMWIEPLSIRRGEGGRVAVFAPNDFVSTWVENHYLTLLREAAAALLGEPLHLELAVDPTLEMRPSPGSFEEPSTSPEEAAPRAARPEPVAGLCDRYTFERFVCGASNELAYSAARAVAADPGTRFNPMFVYGDAGLGKTHLLHAIAHAIRAHRPDLSIVLASAETFTNDYVQAARKGAYDTYRERYRSTCDVLLLDDIQFIAGRARTMEEFFHAFNALHEAGKQIVVTADRLPSELAGMEERLISRLSWGLVADIQPPDPELRRELIRRKARDDGLEVSDDVLEVLATPNFRNVRELEGIVTRAAALARLRGVPLDVGLARQTVAELRTVHPAAGSVTVEAVMRLVARHFGLKVAELKGPRRHKALARARMIAIYLARELTGMSYPALGAAFGGRDHTTMLHAVRRIESLVERDPTIADTVLVLRRRLERPDG